MIYSWCSRSDGWVPIISDFYHKDPGKSWGLHWLEAYPWVVCLIYCNYYFWFVAIRWRQICYLCWPSSSLSLWCAPFHPYKLGSGNYLLTSGMHRAYRFLQHLLVYSKWHSGWTIHHTHHPWTGTSASFSAACSLAFLAPSPSAWVHNFQSLILRFQDPCQMLLVGVHSGPQAKKKLVVKDQLWSSGIWYLNLAKWNEQSVYLIYALIYSLYSNCSPFVILNTVHTWD